DRDLVRLLKNLECKILIYVGYRFGPTLVGGARERDPLFRELAEILHDFRRLWLQDRIGEVADQLVVVAHAVAPRSVCQRSWTRCQRLKARKRGMPPYAGEIRDRCTAIGRSNGRSRGLPQGGHRRCRQYQQGKVTPRLQIHDLLRSESTV